MEKELNKRDYHTVCFDIDGVVTVETSGHDYENRTPNCKNIKIIHNIYKRRSRFRVTFHTSRYGCDKEITEQWFKKYNIPFDEIIYDKPKYDWFVDDKAINVNDLEKYFGWEMP